MVAFFLADVAVLVVFGGAGVVVVGNVLTWLPNPNPNPNIFTS